MQAYTSFVCSLCCGVFATAQSAPSKGLEIRLDRASGSTHAEHVELAASGDAVYAVWEDARNGLDDVYFRSSTDGGVTWSDNDVRLDTDPAGSAYSKVPQIVASGSSVFVVWYDTRNGRGDIYCNWSRDRGATWQSTDIRLDGDRPGTGHSFRPKLAIDGEHVCVVWEDSRRDNASDVYVATSHDHGATWESEQRINTGGLVNSICRAPRIAVAKGEGGNAPTFYVTWSENRHGGPDVFLNLGSGGGTRWKPSDVRLTTSTPGDVFATDPDIAVGGANVYVVWQEMRTPPFFDIRFNRSSDRGARWLSQDVRLDDSAAANRRATRPRIAADGDSVYVTWMDLRNSGFRPDVYFDASHDGGQNWLASNVRLDTDAPGAAHSWGPRIAAVGTAVFVAWEDSRGGGLTGTDVRYNASMDGGFSWRDRDARLDRDPPSGGLPSSVPTVAAADDHVYVAWQDGLADRDIVLRRPFGVHAYGDAAPSAGGTAFDPRLRGFGRPAPGGEFTVALSGGQPFARGALFIGVGVRSRVSIQTLAGKLLVDPTVAIGINLSSRGAMSFTWAVPLDWKFPNANLNFQALLLDGAAPSGLVLTNAVAVWTG